MTQQKPNLSELKALLLHRQQELQAVEQSGDEASQTVELDQTRVGRLSRMDAMQAQAMSIETGSRRKQELQRIGFALKRIDKDDYGFCRECDELINPLRLQSDPAALLCIDCASELENTK